MQVTNAMSTNTPPYHHSCWLLNFVLITIRMVLFLFGPKDTTSMISKNYLKCGLVRPRHTFPLCVSPSQMSLGPEKPVLTCTCRCSNKLWQWFSEEFMSPCGNILDRMMLVFNAVPPEESKVTGIQCWFSVLPLASRDFSRFSEYLDDIMDCR